MTSRALPGWAVDLIRDGVRGVDLRARGDRAVWSALRRTAISAQNQDQSFMEWEALIRDPRSALGRQVALKDGRTVRDPKVVAKTVRDAWDAAWEWRSEQPAAWTPEEAADEAMDRATAARDLAADADADLSDNERALLAFAAAETARRRLTRVTLPLAVTKDATGLGTTALRTAHARLEQKRLLLLVERGRPGGPRTRTARANVYALPGRDDRAALPHYLSRGTRPVVPLTQTCGAPVETASGAPLQTCGAPPPAETDPTTTEQEQPVITLSRDPDGRLTLQAPEHHLEALLAALQAGDLQVRASPPVDLPDNVTPLRAAQ